MSFKYSYRWTRLIFTLRLCPKALNQDADTSVNYSVITQVPRPVLIFYSKTGGHSIKGYLGVRKGQMSSKNAGK